MSLCLLSVASEAYPLIKTGGLADVAGALPLALTEQGLDVRTLIPAYPAVLRAAELAGAMVLPLPEAAIAQVGEGRLLAFEANGMEVLALDLPHFYDRPGTPYLSPEGRDWPDNPLRFAALARVAAEIGLEGIGHWKPDVVHAHDWQAGLTAAYMHYSGKPRPGTVITIHNIAFAGKFPLTLRQAVHLPLEALDVDGVEFYGMFSMLKAGLQFSDRITTVSPSYADEICTAEGGMGFDGLLRARGDVLSGVLNGIDTKAWNPATDSALAKNFTATKLAPRAANKAAVQAHFGLPQDPNVLMYGVVSRLSWQKGLDVLLQAMPALLRKSNQLVVLGEGDRALEDGYRAAATANPGRIGVQIGYDEQLAHLMQAGVDSLLVPSRFEPCGLTQLCALRYGAVPLVSHVGGLADTIIDANPMAIASGVATGIQFHPTSPHGLGSALNRTQALFAEKKIWTKIQQNGLSTDVSWREPARHYAALYRELVPVA
jgi:starch synthase